MADLLPLCVASLAAGLMDSIVGGGGLILLPAMFALLPTADAGHLLGTNKCAGAFGTGTAALRYARRVELNHRVLLPAALVAALGALVGARVALLLDTLVLRRALPVMLVLVLAYTLTRKDLGQVDRPSLRDKGELRAAATIAFVMGTYDGLFGPGAGALFLFLLVRFLGYDFLRASAAAKILNLGGNLGALALFAASGRVWWQLGIPMLVANVAGSLLGSSMALRFGTRFVRVVFLLVVAALIVRTGYDAYCL